MKGQKDIGMSCSIYFTGLSDDVHDASANKSCHN